MAVPSRSTHHLQKVPSDSSSSGRRLPVSPTQPSRSRIGRLSGGHGQRQHPTRRIVLRWQLIMGLRAAQRCRSPSQRYSPTSQCRPCLPGRVPAPARACGQAQFHLTARLSPQRLRHHLTATMAARTSRGWERAAARTRALRRCRTSPRGRWAQCQRCTPSRTRASRRRCGGR